MESGFLVCLMAGIWSDFQFLCWVNFSLIFLLNTKIRSYAAVF